MKITLAIVATREEVKATTANLNNIIKNVNLLGDTSELIDINKIVIIKDTYKTKLEQFAYKLHLKDELTINVEIDTVLLAKAIELADESLQWVMPSLAMFGMLIKQGPSSRMKEIIGEFEAHDKELSAYREANAPAVELTPEHKAVFDAEKALKEARVALRASKK